MKIDRALWGSSLEKPFPKTVPETAVFPWTSGLLSKKTPPVRRVLGGPSFWRGVRNGGD